MNEITNERQRRRRRTTQKKNGIKKHSFFSCCCCCFALVVPRPRRTRSICIERCIRLSFCTFSVRQRRVPGCCFKHTISITARQPGGNFNFHFSDVQWRRCTSFHTIPFHFLYTAPPVSVFDHIHSCTSVCFPCSVRSHCVR